MKCECGNEMKKARVEVVPGMLSEAYKCEKCGELEFTEKQMREALELKEKALELAVVRKIGLVGGSLVIRIPKPVKKALNLKKGEPVKITVERKRMIIQPA